MPPVPTPAEPARPTRTPARSSVRADVGDQAAALGRRVAVVQTVDVAEQDEQVGVHQVRDQGREAVVVAEPDLAGGDRVVLVDDRQHAELEQLREGLVGVAVVTAPGHVVGRQQDLPDDEPVPGELLGVAVHEESLTHGGRGLLRGQGPRAAGQPEGCEAGGDRTGRDQDDLRAAAARGGEHVDEAAYALGVDAPGGGGEGGRADLDHDPAGRGDLAAPGLTGHASWSPSEGAGTRSGSSSEPIS